MRRICGESAQGGAARYKQARQRRAMQKYTPDKMTAVRAGLAWGGEKFKGE